MKKTLVLSVLMALLPLIYSSQNNNSPTTRTIKFVIEDNVRLRAGSSSRYVLELYEIKNTIPTMISHTGNNSNELTVSLEPEKGYTCLFWADNGTAEDNSSGTFDASDLRNVTLNPSKSMEEAFSCKEDFIMSDNISSSSIVLKRAVAQVELIEEGAVSPSVDIVITFNEYTTFDVLTQTAIGNTSSVSKTINTNTATTGLIGSFLTFASTGTNT